MPQHAPNVIAMLHKTAWFPLILGALLVIQQGDAEALTTRDLILTALEVPFPLWFGFALVTFAVSPFAHVAGAIFHRRRDFSEYIAAQGLGYLVRLTLYIVLLTGATVIARMFEYYAADSPLSAISWSMWAWLTLMEIGYAYKAVWGNTVRSQDEGTFVERLSLAGRVMSTVMKRGAEGALQELDLATYKRETKAADAARETAGAAAVRAERHAEHDGERPPTP